MPDTPKNAQKTPKGSVPRSDPRPDPTGPRRFSTASLWQRRHASPWGRPLNRPARDRSESAPPAHTRGEKIHTKNGRDTKRELSGTSSPPIGLVRKVFRLTRVSCDNAVKISFWKVTNFQRSRRGPFGRESAVREKKSRCTKPPPHPRGRCWSAAPPLSLSLHPSPPSPPALPPSSLSTLGSTQG